MEKIVPAVIMGAVGAILLSSCSSGGDSPAAASSSAGDGAIQVVASTDVYGQIAEEIGGNAVEVTSLITSPTQDPHSYEASANDQLVISRAQLILENGGGYDSFVDSLIESTGTTAPVITAVDFVEEHEDEAHTDETAAATEEGHDDHAEEEGHDEHGHIEGLNEHVWYDQHLIATFAEAVRDELSQLSPDDAATFEQNTTAFEGELETIESSLSDLSSQYEGEGVFVTEPVPLYLTAAAGLENVSPDEFTEAVEEDQDVPPAVLAESLALIADGSVSVVILNAQTSGAESEQVRNAADAAGVPVIEFAETLPDGDTYIQWMTDNVQALSDALAE